ncbi:DEAD/DEAH box helicase [Devosia sp. RR2S18]|uniref:DEAD/DEAH box helicase n=1 Tax=Devosia rhizosphaerae TaxID=3049774 RepID=UPI00254053CB|nr:DEAD/DEAH box helicase family protein [Devosia sp. RR2S18]WIJ25203.1 DEAD/DEAH box helicase family protein [Devosia sp. RR2S18]
MSVATTSLNELALWEHQNKAVTAAEAYFKSGSKKGCLIHMPTGTGKTGVMAVLATRRACIAPVLVVCPSAALVEQLHKQFDGGFWNKIGADHAWKPELVTPILPSTVAKVVKAIGENAGKRTIVVGTIQALQQIHAEGLGEQIHDLIGTIIFDEGHREPAPSWAEAIRAFNVPTVLFSATPFRGDLKLFDVDDDHIHFVSFAEAVEQNLIRGIEVAEHSLSINSDTFAGQILGIVDGLVASGRFTKNNKVIIRAGSESSVLELHQAFNNALAGRDDGVIAVHHNFKSRSEPGLHSEVPSEISQRGERFLIHQYMLIEGIDDPSCAVVALFEPFNNTRMLVQQAGRVIRHPSKVGEPAEKAYLIGRQGDGVVEDWKSFLHYDAECVKNGGKPFIRNDAKVLNDLIAALPMMDYVAGKFRQRLDLGSDEIHEDLRFPLSALVYSVEADMDLAELQERISAALSEDDRHEALTGSALGGSCRYHVTLRLNPSPFLAGYLFHGASLEITIYAKCGGRLFFYDSAGLWINEIDGIGPRIDPKTLQSLLPDSSENTISYISVKNTDLGPLALRSRSLAARSLQRSGVFLGEHLNVVTRATGYVSRKRRAVGFDTARVREGDGARSTAEDFGKWCISVNDELDAAAKTASLFSRFALPTAVPADTTPVNILVDMLEVLGQFQTANEGASEIETENLCVDVFPDANPGAHGPFRFSLVVDGKAHDVWIEWNKKKRKYWLTSPGLSRYKSRDNEKISLTRRLNQQQPFRIITSDMSHAYVSGAFYALDLNLADPKGAGGMVLDLIKPITGLSAITSEKGPVRGGNFYDWEDNSLFSFIDKALNPSRGPAVLGAPFPALVCDDLNEEVGDFLAVDDDPANPRVVFVVAKWKDGNPGVSASAFYDVCAQGVKNLAYLKSDGTPGRVPGRGVTELVKPLASAPLRAP